MRWNRWEEDDPVRLKQYLQKYDILLLFLTIFGGFFSAIDLLRSKFLYHDAFYFPLKKNEYNMLRYPRFINLILFENIPQFIIQLIYIFGTNYVENNIDGISIVFISLALTSVSLLFGFLKQFNICMSDMYHPTGKRVTKGKAKFVL